LSTQVPWREYLWILYGASILILIRNIIRVAEYITGDSGPILANEAYIYVFDALLMFIVMVIFNVRHPSIVVDGNSKRTRNDFGMIDNESSEDRINP
jgi:hypothetical protein